jgi:hypothetical protein
MATITTAGALPSDPTTLRNQLVATANILAPGLTTILPGSLVEDMASTATGALVVMDQALCDLVNSISPATANNPIMTQLGNVYGVEQGQGSNTSVLVQFTGNTAGFVINQGFLVSDGTYTYAVQDSTIVPTGLTTAPVFCLATVQGSWAVPANSVTALGTSMPVGITLTVTNPNPGVPGETAQNQAQFRAQVIQAGNAVAQGVPAFVKATIANVPNVSARLIAFKLLSGGPEVLAAGGDPYAIANAIYQALPNINQLQGAQTIGTTQTVTIDDYPDSYTIKFVEPLIQTVTMTINWETISGSNFVSNTVVAPLVQAAIAAYINSIFTGQPINLGQLQATFLAATAGVINPNFLSDLTFAVNVNSSPVTPTNLLYPADPEGYFFALASGITVTNI